MERKRKENPSVGDFEWTGKFVEGHDDHGVFEWVEVMEVFYGNEWRPFPQRPNLEYPPCPGERYYQ